MCPAKFTTLVCGCAAIAIHKCGTDDESTNLVFLALVPFIQQPRHGNTAHAVLWFKHTMAHGHGTMEKARLGVSGDWTEQARAER